MLHMIQLKYESKTSLFSMKNITQFLYLQINLYYMSIFYCQLRSQSVYYCVIQKLRTTLKPLYVSLFIVTGVLKLTCSITIAPSTISLAVRGSRVWAINLISSVTSYLNHCIVYHIRAVKATKFRIDKSRASHSWIQTNYCCWSFC